MSWQSIYPVDVVFWTGRTAKLQVWFSTQRSLFHWYWHRFAASTDCPLEVCKEKTTSSLTDNRKLYVEKRGNYALTQKKIFSLFFTGIPDKDPFRKSAFKAGFHSRRSRRRKRSHKLDGIGVGRIRTFPFLPIPFTTPSLMIQWKLGFWNRSRSVRTSQLQGPELNIITGLFFSFCLRLRQCSFHL